MAEEFLLGINNIFPEVSLDKTPPCSWANHPEQYECVNLAKGMPKKLKFEPDTLSYSFSKDENVGVVTV